MNSVSIRSGRPEDLPEIRRLLRHGVRSYLSVGIEEIPELLRRETTAAAVHPQTQKILGFVSLQQEERSDALPADAPDRVSLRAAAVSSAGAASRAQIASLFDWAMRALPAYPYGHLFLVLTDQRWLLIGLREAGFTRHDEICFYKRTCRTVTAVPQPAILRPVQESDLPQLARLDAAAFDPLWHMGVSALLRLLCDCRLEVAFLEDEPVGYAALYLQTNGTTRKKGVAQLVRLAVHPQAQGLGIGRQLLVASLRHAHERGIHHISLNTQESNVPSQRLYESLRFRKRGHTVPVLVRQVPQCRALRYS